MTKKGRKEVSASKRKQRWRAFSRDEDRGRYLFGMSLRQTLLAGVAVLIVMFVRSACRHERPVSETDPFGTPFSEWPFSFTSYSLGFQALHGPKQIRSVSLKAQTTHPSSLAEHLPTLLFPLPFIYKVSSLLPSCVLLAAHFC